MSSILCSVLCDLSTESVALSRTPLKAQRIQPGSMRPCDLPREELSEHLLTEMSLLHTVPDWKWFLDTRLFLGRSEGSVFDVFLFAKALQLPVFALISAAETQRGGEAKARRLLQCHRVHLIRM